ncbi:hypothetical protein WQ54_09040 [Bacillus sp. SA1-12]|uniref:response regulator transcription factor n=1 Tax=Bacillus sp. SA1-12 TaxID=1455638 RepID=UPI0006258B0A|nr:helix-turn-helix domain-containing protein [Bacillus sp. SA1-12]KKI92503.1 hypothetical protein WQ54_09040 [Bacillus sp. SA1-12]
MINVLIVDDDKLVRKGLISTMPWDKYGLKVVGEANNGVKALEFIESNEVDLLLTDLAMPVMSGLELMRVVSKSHPHISIVVLTMHQEFESIQDALRLGAIDYIAKVQMEAESFDQVIERILSRMVESQSKAGPRVTWERLEGLDIDEGFAILSLTSSDELNTIKIEEYQLDLPASRIGMGVWFWRCDRNSQQVVDYVGANSKLENTCYVMMKLKGLKGKQKSEIQQLLIDYKEKHFFYEYHPDHKVIELYLHDLVREPTPIDKKKITDIKEQWMSTKWVQQIAVFEKLVQELKELHLPTTKLMNLLFSFVNEWSKMYPLVKITLTLPDEINSWYEVNSWIYKVRNIINETISSNFVSGGVHESITKAMRIIHDELSSQIHASAIAKRVNMSRSYFSQCFKETVGMTFNEYVRHVRIEKAKEYLSHTNITINMIAESTGYMDEKYFSRIFRKETGVLPSEYRKRCKKG